jgi:putative ABC transport system permease protein
MLQSYLKTALRFLSKNRTFSLINLIGLALGTLCCLYIILYVKDQYSYDRQFDHAADIYRVTSELATTGDRHTMATTSPPIAPAMKADFPEVLHFTRAIPTLGAEEHLLVYKNKFFYEKDALLVDSTFFDVFNFPFSAGSAAHALSPPNSIVLSLPVAVRLFGDESPIGKAITVHDSWGNTIFTVTGVVDESGVKSSLRANLFIKMNPGGFGGSLLTNNTWTGNNFAYSYVKLAAGASPEALEKKLPALLDKYGAQQFKSDGMTKVLHLQPIRLIHTSTQYDVDMGHPVSTSFLHILILIAVLIQVIACINFMNLSTAKASGRAKEVGIRKVVGARNRSLVFQFLAESFLLALIGVLIAVPMLAFALPYLNQITHADIPLSMLSDYTIWLLLGAIVVATGLVAGSYPAFYLSAFKAIKVIKGNFTSHISAAGIRRSLVVFQFALSILLISSIIVIFSQLNYIKNKDLGFNKDQELIFSFHTDDTRSHMRAFAEDLRHLSGVQDVSMASNAPGAATYHDWGVWLAGGSAATSIDQANLSSDEHFIKTMGIEIVSGRDFRAHDSGSVIVNETLVKRLGLAPSTAPGTRLFAEGPRQFVIAGVMKPHPSHGSSYTSCRCRRDRHHCGRSSALPLPAPVSPGGRIIIVASAFLRHSVRGAPITIGPGPAAAISSLRTFSLLISVFCSRPSRIPDGPPDCWLPGMNTAMTEEADDVPVDIAVHSPEQFKGLDFIDHQRIFLFQVGRLNTLLQIVHIPQVFLPGLIDDRQRDLPFHGIHQLAPFAVQRLLQTRYHIDPFLPVGERHDHILHMGPLRRTDIVEDR